MIAVHVDGTLEIKGDHVHQVRSLLSLCTDLPLKGQVDKNYNIKIFSKHNRVTRSSLSLSLISI